MESSAESEIKKSLKYYRPKIDEYFYLSVFLILTSYIWFFLFLRQGIFREVKDPGAWFESGGIVLLVFFAFIQIIVVITGKKINETRGELGNKELGDIYGLKLKILNVFSFSLLIVGTVMSGFGDRIYLAIV